MPLVVQVAENVSLTFQKNLGSNTTQRLINVVMVSEKPELQKDQNIKKEIQAINLQEHLFVKNLSIKRFLHLRSPGIANRN